MNEMQSGFVIVAGFTASEACPVFKVKADDGSNS
jgi:hypothetical protein